MKKPMHSFAGRLTRRILLLWILMMSAVAAIVFLKASPGWLAGQMQEIDRIVHERDRIPDDAVHGFVGPAEQSDDLTMLAIRNSGKE